MKAVQKLVKVSTASRNAAGVLLTTDSLDLATVRKYKAVLPSRQPNWLSYVLAFFIRTLFIFIESQR